MTRGPFDVWAPRPERVRLVVDDRTVRRLLRAPASSHLPRLPVGTPGVGPRLIRLGLVPSIAVVGALRISPTPVFAAVVIGHEFPVPVDTMPRG